MKIVDVAGSVFISKVNNHHLIKQKILDSIEAAGVFGMYHKDVQSIYNTDYHVKDDCLKRPYINLVKHIIDNHNVDVSEMLGFKHKQAEVLRIWYQQYKTGDWHGWHHHPFSTYSNVYYVQLDAQSPRTLFSHMGKEFEIDVEEGMIISFPSYLKHCSKVNNSPNMKTVIAYNTEYS